MNQPISKFDASHHHHDDSQDGSTEPPSLPRSLPVGDVVIRPDQAGFGIFNYRGEPVLEAPVGTSDEAARLAEEIVSPWQGNVVVDDPSNG